MTGRMNDTRETTALDAFMADTAFPPWVEREYEALLDRVSTLETAVRDWTTDHDDDGPCGCSLCAALGSVPVSETAKEDA